jgi:hypothetical protein
MDSRKSNASAANAMSKKAQPNAAVKPEQPCPVRAGAKDKQVDDIIAAMTPRAGIADDLKTDAEDVLSFIREVAREALAHKSTTEDAEKIESAKEVTTAKRTPGAQTKTKTVHEYEVDKGIGMAPVLKVGLGMRKRKNKSEEIFRFKGTETEVLREQQPQGGRRNKKVFPLVDGKRYQEIQYYTDIAKNLQDAGGQRETAAAVQSFIKNGQIPEGTKVSPETVSYLATLMIAQEGERNVASLVTGPMVLDLIQTGEVSWEEGLDLLPMSPQGAQQEADALNNFLEKKGKLTAGAKRMMDREIAVIKAWVETLDLKFDSEATMESKIAKLKAEIRKRICDKFNITTSTPAAAKTPK